MPFSIMPSVKVEGPKVKAAVRNAPGLEGTPCDGCEHVECIENKQSKLMPWRFWCGALRMVVDPRKVECERDGDGRMVPKVVGRKGNGSYWQAGRAAALGAEGAELQAVDRGGGDCGEGVMFCPGCGGYIE